MSLTAALAPTDATTPYKWTSTRDKAATESAMLASQDDTKVFTFQDDTISYSASALGTGGPDYPTKVESSNNEL